MKSIVGNFYRALTFYGFDAKKFLNAINYKKKYKWFYDDYKELIRQKGNDKTFEFGSMYPILTDRNDEGGVMKGHYFHQDLYVARLINLANPFFQRNRALDFDTSGAFFRLQPASILH